MADKIRLSNESSGHKCSFCWQLDTDTKKMVRGESVNICDHCVELASDIMAELNDGMPITIGIDDIELSAIELRNALRLYYGPSTKFIVRRI